MRTLSLFLAAGVATGLFATSATATPLTLQYDVTITTLCFRTAPACSTVSIGGLDLTVTTDDAVVNRPPVPEPASIVLFSLGLAAIAGTRRRRRSKVE